MDYLVIKWIHILSSTIFFGTGIGSAFYMFAANRRKDIAGIYFATRHVVIADWIFTLPSVITQLVTGLWMVYIAGYNFNETWIFWSLILYFFIVLCWIPVVWIQIKMRDMAKTAFESNTSLPAAYWKLDKWWISLGTLALPSVILVFYFMVIKP